MPAINLSTRLVLLLSACITSTLLVTTTVEYQISKQQLLDDVALQTEATVAAAVRDMEVRLASLEESTELLAEVVALGIFDQTGLRELLQQAVDEREDLFGAALALDPRWSEDPLVGFASYFYYRDGELRYQDLAATYDYVQASWFREAASRGQPVWSEPYFDEGGGNVYMATYAVPVYRTVDAEQVFHGVVTADITLDQLQYYLDRMELGPSGFGLLLSTTGRVMAAPSRDYLLKPLLQILPTGQNASQWAQLLAKVDTGASASARLPCGDVGAECMVKLAPLRTTHWPVGAFYVEDEMLAPLRSHLARTALSTAITLALLVVGVIWVARRITRPLRALASASVDIATGNFSTELPRASSRDELGSLVQAFAVMQANLQRYVAELEAETASRNRLQGELDAAAEIQLSMLPAGGKAYEENAEFALWAGLRPAKSVGGDLYAFHREASGRLFVAVGDVSDKGVPAAIFMARAITLLQQYARSGLASEIILQRLNDELTLGNDNCMFLTLCAGWLDLQTLQLNFAVGGHTPPSLLRQQHCHSIDQQTGPALGLVAGLTFPINQLQLQAGDLLAIYTDGVDEAFNERAEQFGVAAFNQLLLQDAALPLPALGEAAFSALDAHAGASAQSDDITVMLLRLPNVGSAAPARLVLPVEHGASKTLLAWLGGVLTAAGVKSAAQTDLALVAEEVVTNIITHGDCAADTSIKVCVECRANAVELSFSDAGIAFNPLTDATRAELGLDTAAAAIGGLGVHLLVALTDAQEYRRSDNRNHLWLSKIL